MSVEQVTVEIEGMRAIVERFDAFFVDQFGVLHDGRAPYPGAVDALRQLAAAGKPVIVLSNSGKRSAPNAARLEHIGFPVTAWAHFLSSGEVAWSMLATTSFRRCLLLARDDDRSAIDGLPIDLADGGTDCDLVLIAGSEGDKRSLDDYAALLFPAATRGVPAFCTNPDKQMITPLGLRFGAGQIAELYESLGGSVTWIGKPFPAIYDAAKALLRDIDPARIICVGDSVEHDIAGAKGAGLDCCLVRGGIHTGDDEAALARLYSRAGAAPDFVIPAFRW